MFSTFMNVTMYTLMLLDLAEDFDKRLYATMYGILLLDLTQAFDENGN